jgi:hypothetical protein
MYERPGEASPRVRVSRHFLKRRRCDLGRYRCSVIPIGQSHMPPEVRLYMHYLRRKSVLVRYVPYAYPLAACVTSHSWQNPHSVRWPRAW